MMVDVLGKKMQDQNSIPSVLVDNYRLPGIIKVLLFSVSRMKKRLKKHSRYAFRLLFHYGAFQRVVVTCHNDGHAL